MFLVCLHSKKGAAFGHADFQITLDPAGRRLIAFRRSWLLSGVMAARLGSTLREEVGGEIAPGSDPLAIVVGREGAGSAAVAVCSAETLTGGTNQLQPPN